MKIGSLVTSSLYPQKDTGRIINITNINNQNYYEVYFNKTQETLTLEEKDLQEIVSPISRLEKSQFDNSMLFKLRLISEKLESLLYDDKLITANNFKITPLPHQILAVNHVLEQFKPRCLIADEVGLGKTIEAALIFEELKLRNIVKRILIITPAGLTPQWKDELKLKFNEEFSIIDRTTFKALKEIHGNVNIWKNYQYVITSIDFLKPKAIRDNLDEKEKQRREYHNKNVTEDCINAHWDMVIFDEAHKLSKDAAGAETSRFKLGKGLSETAPIFLMLTATPHQGDGEKFRHLLSLLDEYKFYSSDSLTPDNVKTVTVKNSKRSANDFNGNLIFKSRIASLIKIERTVDDIEVQLYNEVSQYVSNYYNLAARAGNFAFMFLLLLYQRMVSSSSRAIYNSLSKRLILLKSVVSSVESKISSSDFEELDNVDAQNAYDDLIDMHGESGLIAITDKIKEEIIILEKCVDLARKASSGRQDFKIRKTIEIINEVIKREKDPKVKFLIFTEFIETQRYLGEILEGLGYNVCYLNGRMKLDEKIDAKLKFKEDHQIMISTDAGGEGINLQFCHVMINYDLPWNPMKIEQRIGRLDRIGQSKNVLVFNFVLKDTVEERVRDILETKLALIASQFGDDKKADVLNFLQDEFNFNKIFIDAIILKENQVPSLKKIGEDLFNRAKQVLEKQELLLPFTDAPTNKKLEQGMAEDESLYIFELVKSYCKLNNIELKEYTKRKKIFYLDKPIFDDITKNLVFDKSLALEDESLEFINLAHPMTKKIILEMLSKESLVFNIEISKSKVEASGLLFYYRLDLTNNQGFSKRQLIPIFIDGSGNYNAKVSKIFLDIKSEVNTGIKAININFKDALAKAEIALNEQIANHLTETKLELYKRLSEEQNKFQKYFEDKKSAIARIPIENIKQAKIQELEQQITLEKINHEKKKALVPNIKLLTLASVNLKK